jgi:hypothetical protein
MHTMSTSGGCIAAIAVGVLVLTGCSTDAGKALTRSRDETIAAARQIRHDTRVQAKPSEGFSGNYGPCVGKNQSHYSTTDRVGYSLETDWITPKSDADDLRTLDYVVRSLQTEGWAASSTRPRVRTMRRKGLLMEIIARPGADWIEGTLAGPCYKVGDAAQRFAGRGIDHLSG